MTLLRKKLQKASFTMAVIIGALSVTACAPQKQMPAMQTSGENSAIKVELTTATVGEISRSNQVSAKIESTQNVKVYPEVSGTVSKVYYSVGDTVEKGALLFELDSTNALTSLQQAQVSYELSLASIESSENGSSATLNELTYQRAIETALESYNRAKTNLDLAADDDFNSAAFRAARRKLTEAEEAYNKDPSADNYQAYIKAQQDYYITIDDYSSYKSLVDALESAYTAYEDAVKKYEIYKTVTLAEDSQTNDLKRQQAALTYESAKKNYDNHKIYAPVSGVISAKGVDPYDVASTQGAAFVIAGDGLPSVSFSISEIAAAALSVKDSITVIYQNQEYTATVSEISPEADNTGLYLAKAQLDTDIGTQRSGTIVKVIVVTAKEENALILPIDLITYDGNQPYVYIYEDGIARRADLEIGITTVDSASVVAGLTADDKIITTWHPNLEDGVAVYSDAVTMMKANIESETMPEDLTDDMNTNENAFGDNEEPAPKSN